MASSQATGKQTPVVEAKPEPTGDTGMSGGQNGTQQTPVVEEPMGEMDGIQTSGGQNGTQQTPVVEEPMGEMDGIQTSGGQNGTPPPSQPSTGENPAEQGPPSGGEGGGNNTANPNGENQSPPDKDFYPETDPNQGDPGKKAPPLSAEGINWFKSDSNGSSHGNKRQRPDSTEIDNSNQSKPLFKAGDGLFNYRAPSHLHSDFDEDLHGDLIGRQEPPSNMKTLELVKSGKTPLYLNQFVEGNARILRIQPMRDNEFFEAGKEPLTSKRPQVQGDQKYWRDVYDILGVAIPGDENNPWETLAKIDPENSDAFESPMSLFILIQWKDNSTTFVGRQWWRNNYVPKCMPSAEKRKTYSIRSANSVGEYRQNKNGFKDYRLLKWAVKHEKMYWEAKHPGQAFHSGRGRSPSPIDDDIAGLREATMPPGTVPPNGVREATVWPGTAPPNTNIGVRDTIEPLLSQNPNNIADVGIDKRPGKDGNDNLDRSNQPSKNLLSRY
ncbi:hypothetical protein BHE90_015791 [Fusarium euwallaceae]|uniref:Uncharacterized protein n=1 Tax=Fusarium euwallaceae TaxID=1147111 RepID=A0A430L292_9HYPO|nr:hypothetical protein BHE90_015791 [Fusarium euwallaceae]